MKYVGDNAPVWSFPKGQRSQITNEKSTVHDSKTTPNSSVIAKKTAHTSRSATLDIFDHISSSRKVGQQKKKSVANKSSRSPRDIFSKPARVPGPGAYNVVVTDISKNIKKIGGYADEHISTRGWGLPPKYFPGVGEYKLENHTIAHRVKKSLGVSIIGRETDEHLPKPSNDLGPGFYDVSGHSMDKSVFAKPQRTVFGRAKRQLDLLFQRPAGRPSESVSPIPSSFDALVKPSSRKGTFGRGKVRSDLFGSPSNLSTNSSAARSQEPSTSTDYFRNKKGALLLGKISPRDISAQDNPGPGHYSATLPVSSPSAVIGKSQRTKEHKSEVPGPGAYYREKSRDSGKLPGATFKSPRKYPKADVIPGPADYVPRLVEDPQKISIPKSGREPVKIGKIFQDPGPGFYDPITRIVWPDSKQVSFGPHGDSHLQSQNDTSNSTKLPNSDRTSFLNCANLDIPGVGHYNPFEYDTLGIKLTGPSSNSNKRRILRPRGPEPGIAFPKSDRKSAIKPASTTSNMTGPGAYTLKPTFPQIASYEEALMRKKSLEQVFNQKHPLKLPKASRSPRSGNPPHRTEPILRLPK